MDGVTYICLLVRLVCASSLQLPIIMLCLGKKKEEKIAGKQFGLTVHSWPKVFQEIKRTEKKKLNNKKMQPQIIPV